ncbi:DUF5675 family protein [Emticicia sp.]|uniref:DUF5675 family protein n=1 Tax=Emticicia sp. TaxID=1930953 RepID=UPI003750D9A4
MKLKLKREPHPEYTIGKLYIDDIFECFTLEDIIRDMKIKGETAIPYGKYKVIINQSIRFKRALPLLLNVPNFEGIRIHTGNKTADTEGCILVGTMRTKDGMVLNSKIAFDKLFPKMVLAAKNNEPITIEIT